MNKAEIVQEQAVNAYAWLLTLETTDAKQANKKLGSAGFGYCCLGIGKVKHKDDGELHIIHEVGLNEVGDYEYSTNLSAWHSHQDFTLVQESCKPSLEELLKDYQEEYDEGE